MLMNIKMIVSVLIIVFLLLMVVNHFFKDLFKLNPFYRNKILLEGFDAPASTIDASGNATENSPVTPATSENAASVTGNMSSENTAVGNGPTGNAPTGNATENTAVGNAPTGNSAVAPSGNTAVGNTAVGNSAVGNTAVGNAPTGNAPSGNAAAPPAVAPEIPDTDKSTIMADLFEKVNEQMDTIRTLKLSNKFVPINIDKTASDPFLILTNLKLLINNGIYKNEMDLKEMYNKYIGNKAVKLVMSEINSINMESNDKSDIGSLETSFLTKCKDIVDGHQKIIDKIIENNRKE